MTPLQRTYAIAEHVDALCTECAELREEMRHMIRPDAQQQIIQELRLEIASLARGNETMHKLIDEQLAEIANLKAGGCARNQGSTQFCAEAVQLQGQMRHMVRIDDPVVTGLVQIVRAYNDVLPESDAEKALSAYEARVKEVGK